MNVYWWFRPSRIALFVALPIVVTAFFSSNQFYAQFGVFNAISEMHFLVLWLSLLGFAGASWLGESLRLDRPVWPKPHIMEGNFQILFFGLALVAVAAAMMSLVPAFLLHPERIMSVLRGEATDASFVLHDAVEQIPGVTSYENFFVLSVVLFMIKPELTGRPRIWIEKALVAVAIVLTLARVIVHTERLALIEMAVPLCLFISGRGRRSLFWSVSPVIGAGLLFLFFMGTEYLRSWTFYSQSGESLFGFALGRLVGYYITAINNGAFIYDQGNSFFFPTWTGFWMWRLPIPGLAENLANATGANIDMRALLAGLNIEFNNPSGLFAPLIDFGPVLGVLIWTALGFFSGRLFRRFVQRDRTGLILFPTWYVGVLELPRIFYWGDSRYFPPLMASLAIIFLVEYLLPRRRTGIAYYAVQTQER